MKRYKNGEGLSILSAVLLLIIILLSFLFFYIRKLMVSGNSVTIQGNKESDERIEEVKKEESGGEWGYSLSDDDSAAQISTYVFVGDSRYVGMSEYSEDGDVFLCENNVGHNFLLKNLENIEKLSGPNTAVIIGLGVNDVNYNSTKYIETLNQMAAALEAHIFYMLVNPVDEEKEKYFGYGILNEKIDEFNQKMKEGMDEDIFVIDTNSYLKMQGYVTIDGLHYTEETYALIYDYIKMKVEEALR